MKLPSTSHPVLFGLATLLGSVAFATPTQAQAAQPPVQMTQPDANSLRLRIDNPSRQPARLVVVHLNDNTCLLNETHREPAYGTRLRFNALPSGRYAVLLRVGPARYRYTVQVDTRAAITTIAVRETVTHRVERGLATASL